jgi:hypothetical protein
MCPEWSIYRLSVSRKRRKETEMHASKSDLPVGAEIPGFESRQAEWGGFTAAIETLAGGLDATDMFADLPDGRCQSPHWGFVLKGKLRVKYADHAEVIDEGEAYYLPPGHIPATDADTVVVEFSPSGGEYEKTLGAAGAIT